MKRRCPSLPPPRRCPRTRTTLLRPSPTTSRPASSTPTPSSTSSATTTTEGNRRRTSVATATVAANIKDTDTKTRRRKRRRKRRTRAVFHRTGRRNWILLQSFFSSFALAGALNRSETACHYVQRERVRRILSAVNFKGSGRRLEEARRRRRRYARRVFKRGRRGKKRGKKSTCEKDCIVGRERIIFPLSSLVRGLRF